MGKLHDAVVKRRDMYEVDPAKVMVQEGWNPRKVFDAINDEDDKELLASIVANGVLKPITVRNVDGTLYIVDGWRRHSAVLAANANGSEIVSIPAIMARKGISDSEAMFEALNSNSGKRLKPSEEAEAFARLIKWGLSIQEIATRVGKSYMTVQRRLEIQDAAPEVKKAVDSKEINSSDARTIVKQSEGNIDQQKAGLEKAKEKKAKAKKERKTLSTYKKEDRGDAGTKPVKTPKVKVAEDGTVEIKMLTKTQIEKLIAERKGILAFSTERLQHINEGILIALNMVLYGQTEVPKIGE